MENNQGNKKGEDINHVGKNNMDIVINPYTTWLFLITILVEVIALVLAFCLLSTEITLSIYYMCSAIYLHISRPMLLRIVSVR